jgi:hypothetical protein
MRVEYRRALPLIVLTAFGLAGLSAGTPVAPSLAGRIYAGGDTPLAGVQVVAVNLETEERFASQPTDVQGRYAVSDLPQGYYDVAVRTDEGWFVAERPVRVPQQGTAAVSLSVTQQAQQGAQPATPAPKRKKGIGAFWSQLTDPLGGPVVGSAVVVGGLAVGGVAIANLTDDDDPSCSSDPCAQNACNPDDCSSPSMP